MNARIPGHLVLKALPAWTLSEDQTIVRRELVFADFSQAFGFMTEVALYAQTREHHPEWTNVFNRVSVALTTHDMGGLTGRDIDMGRYIDGIVARHS